MKRLGVYVKLVGGEDFNWTETYYDQLFEALKEIRDSGCYFVTPGTVAQVLDMNVEDDDLAILFDFVYSDLNWTDTKSGKEINDIMREVYKKKDPS